MARLRVKSLAWSLVPIAAMVIGCGDEATEGLQETDAGTGVDASSASDTGTTSGTDSGTMLPADAGSTADAGMVTPDAGQTTGNVIDLGSQVLDGSGIAGPINFEIPAGVTTFTVLVSGANEDVTYLVRRLEGPTGILVSDDPVQLTPLEQFVVGAFPSQFKSPNRVIPDVGIAAALFPNNPAVQVTSGSYQVWVQAGTITQSGVSPYSGSVDVSVQYKTGQPTTGRIDVNIHLTGASGITTSNAETSPLMSGAVTRLREIYRQAGIEVGTVRYFDIDSRFTTVQSLDGPNNDLSQMLKLSAGAGPGLNYFMVDSIQGPIPGAIGGVAGGLPGPGLHPGTVASGVAVAYNAAMNNPGVLAHIMAHEGGHWLGLFHTIELFGGVEDQLPDTPAQGSEAYLMYPAVGGGQDISASQAAVMRSHVEIRHP